MYQDGKQSWSFNMLQINGGLFQKPFSCLFISQNKINLDTIWVSVLFCVLFGKKIQKNFYNRFLIHNSTLDTVSQRDTHLRALLIEKYCLCSSCDLFAFTFTVYLCGKMQFHVQNLVLSWKKEQTIAESDGFNSIPCLCVYIYLAYYD